QVVVLLQQVGDGRRRRGGGIGGGHGGSLEKWAGRRSVVVVVGIMLVVVAFLVCEGAVVGLGDQHGAPLGEQVAARRAAHVGGGDAADLVGNPEQRPIVAGGDLVVAQGGRLAVRGAHAAVEVGEHAGAGALDGVLAGPVGLQACHVLVEDGERLVSGVA